MKNKVDLVKAWIKKAENNLIAAEHSLRIKLYDITCFHAQQSAEKYIKGFLTYYDIESEKTHSIEDLLLLASQIDSSFADLIDKGKKLTPYAVEIRYPLLIEEPTEEECLELLKIAKQIENFVLNRLPIGEGK